MPEMTDPGGPLWWLLRLERDRRKRKRQLEKWNDYYEGRHPLAFATSKYRTEFADMFRAFSDNWMMLVVDAVEERLNVEGFRFDRGDTQADNEGGDRDAWYIWQANNLDGDSGIAHVEALIAGQAFVLVDPTVMVGAKEAPQVTVEHASQMVLAVSPENRRRQLAAAKFWTDDDDRQLATLYLPDRVWKFQRSRGSWVAREGANESVANPLREVPVVALSNRERLIEPAKCEFDHVIPLQDACNKLVADMLVASEYAAFVQRWATGLEVPEDPETGKPIEPFKVAVDRLLWSSDQETRFGQFEATDLKNYVGAIELVIQHIAALTRTPPHYLLGQAGTFPSGESLKSTETGLIAKTRRKMRSFEESWETALRLCFKAKGDVRGDAVWAETIWRDPESRTESEHVDATIKKLAAGVPQQQIWEDLGYSPTQIGRFRTMLLEQAMLGAVGTPVPEISAAAGVPALVAGDGTGGGTVEGPS